MSRARPNVRLKSQRELRQSAKDCIELELLSGGHDGGLVRRSGSLSDAGRAFEWTVSNRGAVRERRSLIDRCRSLSGTSNSRRRTRVSYRYVSKQEMTNLRLPAWRPWRENRRQRPVHHCEIFQATTRRSFRIRPGLCPRFEGESLGTCSRPGHVQRRRCRTSEN